MSRGRLDARLERLEQGSAAARALGREIVALLDEYVERFGEAAIVDVLPLFGLTSSGGEQ